MTTEEGKKKRKREIEVKSAYERAFLYGRIHFTFHWVLSMVFDLECILFSNLFSLYWYAFSPVRKIDEGIYCLFVLHTHFKLTNKCHQAVWHYCQYLLAYDGTWNDRMGQQQRWRIRGTTNPIISINIENWCHFVWYSFETVDAWNQ